MSFVIFPKYSNLYDGKVPTLNAVLQGIPSETVVSFACYINAQKHLNPFEVRVDLEIFRQMIERLPKEKFEELGKRLKSFTMSAVAAGQTVSIFPLSQMLQLIEFALENFVEGNLQPLEPEKEENLLKAILIINESIDEKHTRYGNVKTKDQFVQFQALMWPMMLPTNEYTYRKEIVIPLYQSLLLFDFLLSHKTFKTYVDTYLSKNGTARPTEHLKHLASFYLFSYDKEKKTFFTYYTKADIEKNPVLLQFVRSVDKSSAALFAGENKSRKLLREKPILKTTDDKFFITNWNFIIDKVYEGFKYDFFENSGVKEKLKGNDDKEKWNSFTGTINQTFNEKIVFLDVVNRLLKKPNVTFIPEDNSKGWNQDLYIRRLNHVAFIEFKGVVFPISEDYHTIKNDIDERMIFNKKDDKKKAVFQLIDQIVSFHSNVNKFENIDYVKERICIYPVIVYTDYNWGMAGVNDYVAQIFDQEISKHQLDFFSIEKLVMIHIDFLNTYEKIFLEGNLYLHQVIFNARQSKESYKSVLKFSVHPNDIINSLLDFGFYAAQVYKKWWVHPHQISLFNEVMAKLEVPKS